MELFKPSKRICLSELPNWADWIFHWWNWWWKWVDCWSQCIHTKWNNHSIDRPFKWQLYVRLKIKQKIVSAIFIFVVSKNHWSIYWNFLRQLIVNNISYISLYTAKLSDGRISDWTVNVSELDISLGNVSFSEHFKFIDNIENSKIDLFWYNKLNLSPKIIIVECHLITCNFLLHFSLLEKGDQKLESRGPRAVQCGRFELKLPTRKSAECVL